MNKYTNALLTAVGIMSDKKMADAGYSKIINATIVDISKADKGEYRISYQNASYTAKSDNKGYKLEDVVSVLTPGNAGDPYQILNLAQASDKEVELKNSWEDEFDRMDTNLCFLKEDSISITSSPQTVILYDKAVNPNSNKLNIDIAELIKSIKASGYFQVALDLTYNFNNLDATEKLDLNYGLVFEFKNQVCRFDINDILASPFVSVDGFNHNKIFKIENLNDIELKKIYLFVDIETEQEFEFKLNDLNIFGLVKTNYDAGNVAIIEAQNGVSFENTETLIFSTYLRENGIKVLDTSKLQYRWARANRNSTSQIFGVGWQDLGVYGSEITLRSSDYKKSSVAIKAAIIKDGNTTISSAKNIYQNSANIYDFQLQVFNGQKSTEKLLVVSERYDKPLTNVEYEWYHIDSTGTEHIESNTISSLTVDLTQIKGSWIYGCRVSIDGMFIEAVEKTLDMELLLAKGRVRIEGASAYFYNMGGERQGKSPTPLKAHFFDEQGNELKSGFTIDWLVPKQDTMIIADTEINSTEEPEYWVYSFGNKIAEPFRFKLQNFYNVKADQNTVIARITDSDGLVYSGSADIGILRTGAPGTNGTEVLCVISPTINYSNQGTPEFIQVNENDTLTYQTRLIDIGTGEELPIHNYKIIYKVRVIKNVYAKIPQVDENGNKVYDEDGNEILVDDVNNILRTYTAWEKLEDQEEGFSLTAGPNILQAQILPWDKENEADVLYRAYLPIAYYSDTDYYNPFKLKSQAGFSHVLYSSAGTNPSYSENEFEFTVDDEVGIEGNSAPLQVSLKAGTTNQYLVTAPAVYKIEDSQKLITVKFTHRENYIEVPFLFLKNSYENAIINGWDGESIVMDEESGTILSPMAGFGKKEDDNSFTGVLLGESTGGEEKVGIFGRNHGKESFFLDAKTGAAYFGEAGSGQIKIIPNQDIDGDGKVDAIIEGGSFTRIEYDENGEVITPGSGMLLNLGKKPSIEWGNGCFKIDEDGNLTLKGHIDAVSGTIAGFNINGDKIEKGDVGLSSSGNYAFWAGDLDQIKNEYPFSVKHDGTIIAKNGRISGFQFNENKFLGKDFNNGYEFFSLEPTSMKLKYQTNDFEFINALSAGEVAFSANELLPSGLSEEYVQYSSQYHSQYYRLKSYYLKGNNETNLSMIEFTAHPSNGGYVQGLFRTNNSDLWISSKGIYIRNGGSQESIQYNGQEGRWYFVNGDTRYAIAYHQAGGELGYTGDVIGVQGFTVVNGLITGVK